MCSIVLRIVRYRGSVDVVIVGGGIIGLSAAWRLQQAGLQVAVWDKGGTGTEASWAGAGMLAPGGEMDAQTWWGDLALESLKLYPEFVLELADESGLAIDYRRCGAMEFADTEADWERLQARAKRQREWGIAVESAGGNKLFYPGDSAVDPRDLLRALRAACARRGVPVREHRTVTQITAVNGLIVEPEAASAAVLSAGAWSSSVPVRIDGSAVSLEPSQPVRGHLISFAPSGHPTGPILREGHTYILERSSGLTIAGSTTEQVGFERRPDPALFADIERRARKLMPRLHSVPRCDEWIGFRPGTASGNPQLGRIPASPVYLGYGHYRNGILMAPRTATLLTEQITANSQTGSFLPAARH